MRILISFCFILASLQIEIGAVAAEEKQGPFIDHFQQLDDRFAPGNDKRTASGAPGSGYWQQRADYVIKASLDEEARRLTGEETITYTNHSPDPLTYLWLQLDQNRFAADSESHLTQIQDEKTRIPFATMRQEYERDFGGGFTLHAVKDSDGEDLAYTIVGTMMRLDLPHALEPGQRISFSIAWDYTIIDGTKFRTRGGYEFFEKDGNDIFTISQWYPRMAAYTDTDGWVIKPLLGDAEFALEFGDFVVEITVPDDHVVAATGLLQNAGDVLSAAQQGRLSEAASATKPIFIVTEDEAKDNELNKGEGAKTWVYQAQNVRDFAFASSRKFIWDAMGVAQSDDSTVLAMSFYSKEANPLWAQYSTQSVAHALEVYSSFTFPYPYPVAQSVLGAMSGGMEYPMISFNGPRPDKADKEDKKTYSRGSKYGLIGVVIHETGHNYFPMIINSNERRWGWMDEGLNTFLQFQAEQAWEKDFPSRSGEPRNITYYMKRAHQAPIMTQPDAIPDLSSNAYGKVAASLVVLRETILGRDLFDFAFREYARRWMFKRPTPVDFFRTMEDASGRDLDWFWRGWFYGTGAVDQSIDGFTRYSVNTKNPEIEKARERDEKTEEVPSLTTQRNEGAPTRLERFPELADFYNENDKFTVSNKERNTYNEMLKGLEDWKKELLLKAENFYMVDISNPGGLVMPVIMKISYSDGSEEEIRLPAEVWRRTPDKITKLLVREKAILTIQLDPYLETADVNTANNMYPREPETGRIELYKFERYKVKNLMKDMAVKLKTDEKKEDVKEEGASGANSPPPAP